MVTTIRDTGTTWGNWYRRKQKILRIHFDIQKEEENSDFSYTGLFSLH